jgi:uncharacterized protein (TIGR02444 family)
MDNPKHPFWDWSLAAYRRPGVEEILLDLQDRHGLDVNLLLFACWIGATGRGRLSNGMWTELIGATADWRATVIEPLRAVRRQLKGQDDMPGAAMLRQGVKALELDAERVAQLAIAGLTPNLSEMDVATATRIADTSANLEDCIAASRRSLSPGHRKLLASLARSICVSAPT